MKRIVTIGGGTGTYTLLRGLKTMPVHISAIVSMADNGGSSGILRDELGVLPPGDVRQALTALSKEDRTLRKLFTYRFDKGHLKGHQFGNLFLSALEKIEGNFDEAVIEAAKILGTTGDVIPVTAKNIRLIGTTKLKKKIIGQHEIDRYIWSNKSPITSLKLSPNAQLNKRAKVAIEKADMIVIGPGSLYTSLIPNLLVKGMGKALVTSKAKIVYIANLMTEKGQTAGFNVNDYISVIESYLPNRIIDIVLANNKAPTTYLLNKYRQEMERIPVTLTQGKNNHYKVVANDFLNHHPPKLLRSDKLSKTRSLIRHDSQKLAQALYDLII